VIETIADIARLEQIAIDRQIDVWTIGGLLARGAARDPKKTALHYLPHGDIGEPSEQWSFERLSDMASRAASLFRACGVGPRDAVAILLPNVPQNYVAMFGATAAGIAFPINWMLSADHIAELLRAARPKLVVTLGPTPGYNIHEKCQILRSGSDLRMLEVRGPDGTSDPALDFDALCALYPPEAPLQDQAKRDADAFYIHTGGTTSAPKIARITHRNVAYKCWAISAVRGIDPAQVVFAASPLFHVGGIVLRTINVLAQGQTSVIPGPTGFRNKSMLANYWKFVERFAITELAGVPTTLGALTTIPIGGADVSSLRPHASTGASSLPQEVAGYFERTLGIQIRADYGMTETTASVSAIPKVRDAKPAASGIRLPFTEIRIVAFSNEGGIIRICGVDEIGEIVVRGPAVIPGYLDPALDRKLFVGDGWVRTADLGRLDADGYLWVTGRASDIIIRSGHNIDPLIIEEALMAHDAVSLVAAVGKPDAYAGELPVAYVQLKSARSTTADELREFACARIPERAAAPVEIFLLDQLPVTGVGKIIKQQLRDLATCHAIDQLLSASLPADMLQCVEIVPDKLHGSLISIGVNVVKNDGMAKKIAEVFARFSQRYVVRWRNIQEYD
jgi:fatty-acyl-CoA synthase